MDVRPHEIIVVAGQQLLVHGQRFRDRLRRNSANGLADVVEDVIPGNDGLIDDVESHRPAHAPEIAEGFIVVDAQDQARNAEAHSTPPDLRSRMTASATSAWPREIPPSPGGTC